MKDFTDYLQETPNEGICWWMRQPMVRPLQELVYFCYERFETVRYDYAMIETLKIRVAYEEYRKKFAPAAPNLTKEIWMAAVNIGEHFKISIDSNRSQSDMNSVKLGLKKLLACPSRASWAWYDGEAYRGTTLGMDDFKSVKFKDAAFTGSSTYLIGDITYSSRYEGQSWSTTFRVAETFGKTSVKYVRERTNRSRVMAVMEAQLTKQETLFDGKASSDILNAVMGSIDDEEEVLRLSNKPIRCKVYVPLRGFVAMMQNAPGGYGKDPEWSNSDERTTVWDWKKEDGAIFMRHFRKFFTSVDATEKAFKALVSVES